MYAPGSVGYVQATRISLPRCIRAGGAGRLVLRTPRMLYVLGTRAHHGRTAHRGTHGRNAPAPQVTAQLKPPLGLFEERASELMAAGRWLEAHDVVAGELLDADAQAEAQAGRAAHAHDARFAARLLEGICQHELACADGLGAALEAHAADIATPLACGCALSAQAVEPFAGHRRLGRHRRGLDRQHGALRDARGHGREGGATQPGGERVA